MPRSDLKSTCKAEQRRITGTVAGLQRHAGIEIPSVFLLLQVSHSRHWFLGAGLDTGAAKDNKESQF